MSIREILWALQQYNQNNKTQENLKIMYNREKQYHHDYNYGIY